MVLYSRFILECLLGIAQTFQCPKEVRHVQNHCPWEFRDPGVLRMGCSSALSSSRMGISGVLTSGLWYVRAATLGETQRGTNSRP